MPRLKTFVEYWFVVTATGRKPEYFHPSEKAAADAYYHKCLGANLDPLMQRKEVAPHNEVLH